MSSRITVDEDLVRSTCLNATSMRAAARSLGIHINTLKRIATKLGCYMPKQNSRPIGWVPRHITQTDLELYYFNNSRCISPANLRKVLIREGIKDTVCELCGNREWLGKPIPLELHHKDGDRYNNALENLLIVCPTCHAWFTDNCNTSAKPRKRHISQIQSDPSVVVKRVHKPRESKPREKKPSIVYTYECPQCNIVFTTKEKNQKYCSYACAHKSERKFEITAEELLKMFQEEANYTKIAKKLGVSDNAVKKRCKRLGIYDDVKLLIDEAKRERAIANQTSQDADFRRNSQQKAMQTVYDNMDYYIGYTVVADKEVELVRFENTQQLRDAGYSLAVVQRACNTPGKRYKGWYWRRESKIS